MNKNKLKILFINVFFHLEGGADTDFFNTARLLEEQGHEVLYFCMKHPLNKFTKFSKYFVSCVDFRRSMTLWQQIKAIPRLFWSFEANKKLRNLIINEKPDIAHIHNLHYEISPSIVHILKKYKIPTVMTLHDYTLVCPQRTLFVGGHICEECKNGKFYNVIKNKCIRKSYLISFIVFLSTIFHHRIVKTYEKINFYISPSKFLINKCKEMGFNSNFIYLPHFVYLENKENADLSKNNNIIYFGRLQQIKGIEVLLDAIKEINVFLKIIGRGPWEEQLKEKVKKENIINVQFLDYMEHEKLKEEIKKSLFFVLPSIWHDNYPFAILESFSLCKPVVAANVGGIPELVKDGERGLLFNMGDSQELRKKIVTLINDPCRLIEMGKKAYEFVNKELSPDFHYKGIIEIYEKTKLATGY